MNVNGATTSPTSVTNVSAWFRMPASARAVPSRPNTIVARGCSQRRRLLTLSKMTRKSMLAGYRFSALVCTTARVTPMAATAPQPEMCAPSRATFQLPVASWENTPMTPINRTGIMIPIDGSRK
jgi:hypothetical protein